MQTFNPNKMLPIEIYSNDPANVYGYTIWHIHSPNNRAISRNADGKDFDWMTEKETKAFEGGQFKFKISARDAMDYFQYSY